MIDYHIDPLDQQDTSLYIEHRLKKAGSKSKLFNNESKKLIYHYSSGVPRVINGIADMALFEAYVNNKPSIDTKTIESVVHSSHLDDMKTSLYKAQIK